MMEKSYIKKCVLLVCCLLVEGGLWAQNPGRNANHGEERRAARMERAGKQAQRRLERSDIPGDDERTQARLVMDRTNFNFGDVERKGGDLEHEFVFRNEGDAPLVLIRVITSCSCLKAFHSKRPIAPGEEGVLRIVYEPHKSEPGAFNKVIRLYSNSVGGCDVVTVQGNSIDGRLIRCVKNGK